ncbi:MAG: GrpB family protein [Pseudomonadota bacterium]
MRLTSTITEYDPTWTSAYQAEAGRIAPLIGENLVSLHHVGSTAIAGLAAKPEIDILVEVKKVLDYSRVLGGLGYRRGNDLSPGHQFYKKDVGGVRTHKVHVCVANHVTAEEMKRFLEILTRDSALRREYQQLKYALEASNTHGIAEYLAGKAPFVRRVLNTGGSLGGNGAPDA